MGGREVSRREGEYKGVEEVVKRRGERSIGERQKGTKREEGGKRKDEVEESRDGAA